MAENLGGNFQIDVTNLKAGLALANKMIRESESEFKAAAAGMEDWKDSEEGLTASIKNLSTVTDLQEKKVEALQKQYDDLIENGLDPASSQAIQLRTQINNETTALNKNKSALANAEKSLSGLTDETEDALTPAQKLRKEIEKQEKDLEELKEAHLNATLSEGKNSAAAKDLQKKIDALTDELQDNKKALGDVAEAAEDSGDGFTVAKGAIAGFIANGLTALAGGIKNAISGLANLADETAHYRTQMAKLETGFETAGLRAEDAANTYKELYSVLGDEDKATEASAFLGQLASNSKELTELTDVLTGVYATFGDALPLEGLTEAINHTTKLGSVQGNLADALEWSGVNVDDFNAALAECNTEQERQELITTTLNGLYSEASKTYKEVNKDVIAANAAQSDFADTQAKVGEKIQPVSTAIKDGFNGILESALSLTDDVDMEGFADKIKDGFSWVSENLLPIVLDGIEFLIENLPLVATLAGAVGTAISVSTGNIPGIIGGIVTMLGGLTLGLASIETEADKRLDDAKELKKSVEEASGSFANFISNIDKNTTNQLSKVEGTKILVKELQNISDETGKVQKADETRAAYILGELSDALGHEIKLTDGQIENYQEIIKEVGNYVNAKKAEIMFAAQEEKYAEALRLKGEQEKKSAQIAIEVAEQKKAAESAYTELLQAEKDYQYGIEHKYSMDSLNQLLRLSQRKYDEYKKEKEALDTKSSAYKDSEILIASYYDIIGTYDSAATELAAGNVDKVISILESKNSAFRTAASVAKESAEEQKRILGQQVIDTEVAAQMMKERYLAGVEGVTQAQVDLAREQAENAKTEFFNVGGVITKSMTDGGNAAEYQLSDQMNDAIKEALNAVDMEMHDFYESGEELTGNVASGANSGKSGLTNTMTGVAYAALTPFEKASYINQAKAEGKSISEVVAKGIDEKKGSMKTSMAGNASAALLAAREKYMITDAETTGKNLASGIETGVNSKKTTLGTTMANLASSMLRSFKTTMQIASPSKVFRKEAQFIPLGVAAGVEDAEQYAVDSVKSMSDDIAATRLTAPDVSGVNAAISGSASGERGSGGNAAKTGTAGGSSVVVNQVNNYSQAHSRYELFKSKQDIAAAVKLVEMGV